jgi:transcriptional regulator with XRE-family HTH domain
MDRAHVVGRRIKRLRELCSLSKSELARLVGVSPTAVHNWEENGVMPRMGVILKLEKVLEVSWMQLVSRVPDGEGAGVVPRQESEDLSGLTRGQHLERYKREIAALFDVDASHVDISIKT